MTVSFIDWCLDSWYAATCDFKYSFSFIMQIQTGDPTGTGSGGESYWGTPFRDEHDLKNAAKHDSRGMVAMANKGANTNRLALFGLCSHVI